MRGLYFLKKLLLDKLLNRYGKGISYNFIGTIFNQGSTFLVNVITANLLGRTVFGKYAMIQNTLLSFSVIAQLATGYTASKYVAEFRTINKERAGRILGTLFVVSAFMACLGAALLFGGANWLTHNVLNAPDLTVCLMIGAGMLIFSIMNGYLMGALSGLESYQALAKALVISGISYAVICPFFTWMWNLEGAIQGLLISAMIQWVVLGIALKGESNKQNIIIYFNGMKREYEIILKFALPGAISGFTSIPAIWLGNTFLARQTNGFSQLAIYSAAYNLMALVLFLPSIVNNVGMSLINNHTGLGEASDYRKIFFLNLFVTAAIVSIGLLILLFLGPKMMALFGKNFNDGQMVLFILLSATIPEALTIALNQIVQSQAKMWLAIFVINVPRDSAIIFLAYIFTSYYGVLGLAMAYLSGRMLALILMGVLVWKIGLKGRALTEPVKV